EAKKIPPIRPIVKVFKVSEIYKEFSEKVRAEISCDHTPPLTYSLFFEYLLNKALLYTKVKYSYGSRIIKTIEKLTQKTDFKICTVCGVLPAILYDNGDKLDVKDNNAEDRLCPYCAIKRLLKGKVISNVVQKLDLLISQYKWRFPSTSELAMLNFAYHMKDEVRNLVSTDSSEEIGVKEDWINKLFETPAIAENYCKCYSGNKEACEKLVILDKENLKKYGNLYFAIVKANGDNLGKLWKGILLSKEGKLMTLKEYLNTVLGYLKEIGYTIELDVNKVEDEIKDARKKLYNTNENLESVPITMSYAYTLSRTLTMQAIVDKQLLEENRAYPIYLGGDDILALSPVRYMDKFVVLDSVKKTREAYWEYSDNPNTEFDGFKSFNGIVVDSLRTYGRSYALFIAHYRDPLTMSISLANYYLELKDEVIRTDDIRVEGEMNKTEKNEIKRKDVLFVSSGRGMAKLEFSALKMSEGNKIELQFIDLINSIDEKIRNKDLSRSFIYDSLALEDYAVLACDKANLYTEIYQSLVKRTVSRNAKNDKVSESVLKMISQITDLGECIIVKDKVKEAYLNMISSLADLF
ncbi:type III-B CRISPR-associated protein Cas10/Cmr2, partial [Sulfolobus sp. F3]